MITTYCEKWWFAKNSPIAPLGERAARSRHENREPYTAVLWHDEQPTAVVDIAGPWVSVAFVDTNRRQFLSYDFKGHPSGRLFLTTAVHREYDANGSEGLVKVFGFKEDGSIHIEERNSVSGDKREYSSNASVAPNWELYPEFGNYCALCRIDRTRGPAGRI